MTYQALSVHFEFDPELRKGRHDAVKMLCCDTVYFGEEGELKRLVATCILVCAVNISTPTIANPYGTDKLRKFTLTCTSSKVPSPPIPTWVVDVNLDLMSYYVESQFGGLNEIKSDDGKMLIFYRWGCDMHGVPMATLETFDRENGNWYFSPTPDVAMSKPDAKCIISPPRDNFKAEITFSRP